MNESDVKGKNPESDAGDMSIRTYLAAHAPPMPKGLQLGPTFSDHVMESSVWAVKWADSVLKVLNK